MLTSILHVLFQKLKMRMSLPGILVSGSEYSSDDESVERVDYGPEFKASERVPDFAPEGVQNLHSGNQTLSPHPAWIPNT